MNEKLIEQLAEQAGMMRDKFGLYWNAHNNPDDGLDLEKFTEFVVLEFAQHLTNIGCDHCREQIEKHFGVKK